jgi:sirohydrochlorin cobaltochelatase
MEHRWVCWWLSALLCCPMLTVSGVEAASMEKPAIVLVAFGTSTKAFETYNYFEQEVRKAFPNYELRWAFTSKKIREKLKAEGKMELKTLADTLQELKAAGFNRVAVQSLHVVPGAEWEKKVLSESRHVPGLKISWGKPLLSSKKDRLQVLEAVKKLFPPNLNDTAVVLVAHGSPSPRGEAEYLAVAKLLRSRYPKQNVFLGVVEGKPSSQEALDAVKRSSASKVLFVPLLFVAGEHMHNDIMGDSPDSWKSMLLKHKPYEIQDIDQGLGYQAGIIKIYLDHLAQALKTL